MLIEKLKAKIHRATVTDANLNYVGSITNGQRFETYVITGESGGGAICLNGACARLAEVDDKVIIMAYCLLDGEENATFAPKLVFVNDKNQQVDQSEVV